MPFSHLSHSCYLSIHSSYFYASALLSRGPDISSPAQTLEEAPWPQSTYSSNGLVLGPQVLGRGGFISRQSPPPLLQAAFQNPAGKGLTACHDPPPPALHLISGPAGRRSWASGGMEKKRGREERGRSGRVEQEGEEEGEGDVGGRDEGGRGQREFESLPAGSFTQTSRLPVLRPRRPSRWKSLPILPRTPAVNVSSLPIVRLGKLRPTQMWQLTGTQFRAGRRLCGRFCTLENKTKQKQKSKK